MSIPDRKPRTGAGRQGVLTRGATLGYVDEHSRSTIRSLLPMSTPRRRCHQPTWGLALRFRAGGSSSRHGPGDRLNDNLSHGAADMIAAIPQLLRLSRILLMLLSAALVAPQTAMGQGDCEAIPAGRGRTDCFIGRARILNQQSNIARDKARLEGNSARLQAATGRSARPAALCQGKGAGTRACYTCCRTHGFAASRCLRNCRPG